MTTELATYQPGSLTIAAEQTNFSDEQAKALQHIGVENASHGDLKVFFHVCQRTGLDPFARQIYMISRQVSERGPDGNWTKVTKQTIQTGIDGFRLIGRRAADRAGHKVSLSAPEWAAQDGWKPLWSADWGVPLAARVTITRDGEPFTAVALFDEYKQTKRDGTLTQMWAQRPAGQIAKCAEALAWRMAFPQDLSGIYTDDETAHAANPQLVAEQVAPADLLAQQTADVQAPRDDDVSAGQERRTDDVVDAEPMFDYRSTFGKAFYASINAEGIPEQHRIRFVSEAIGRPITSTKELTDAEARDLLDNLPALAANFLAEVAQEGAES